MRVQFVSSGLGVGGAERFLVRLCPRLHEQGIDVAVLGLQGGALLEELRAAGVRAEALGIDGWRMGLTSLNRARKLIKDFAPTIVQGWMYHGCLAATVLRGQASLAWSIRQSSEPASLSGGSTRLSHGIARALSRCPDAIIYNSLHAMETHARAGFANRHARVIANGFECAQSVDRATARAALALPIDAFVVGHVARWHPVKDHETLLRAFRVLSHSVPEARLVLVGEGIDPRNGALLALIERHSLQGLVHLLGHHQFLERVYSSMDVVCLSSRSEAFPNVLAEAMALSVPCVSTAVGDVERLIGDTGRLVPAGDAAKLAQALVEVARMKPEQREALGQAAKARIERDYGIESAAQVYAQAYRELKAG